MRTENVQLLVLREMGKMVFVIPSGQKRGETDLVM